MVGGFNPCRDKRFSPLETCSDWLWGPPILQFNGYWKELGHEIDHACPSSAEVRMSGTAHLQPRYMPSWSGQENFTFPTASKWPTYQRFLNKFPPDFSWQIRVAIFSFKNTSHWILLVIDLCVCVCVCEGVWLPWQGIFSVPSFAVVSLLSSSNLEATVSDFNLSGFSKTSPYDTLVHNTEVLISP